VLVVAEGRAGQADQPYDDHPERRKNPKVQKNQSSFWSFARVYRASDVNGPALLHARARAPPHDPSRQDAANTS
jgi:hypothetical protein